MKRVFLAMVVMAMVVWGCAPTGKKVTKNYDEFGDLTSIVEEDVYNGKYSVYGDMVEAVYSNFKEIKALLLDMVKETLKPIPGESTDLAAYKQGRAAGMIDKIMDMTPADMIEALHYGQDELDVQAIAVNKGADTLQVFAIAGAIWKTLDTAFERSGDVNVGEGGSYESNEHHVTGVNDSEVTSTLDKSDRPVVFEPVEATPSGE